MTEQYRQKLYDYVDRLSQYYEDIAPEKNDTIDDLLEKYFYWVTEYNDNYDVILEKPETDFEKWLSSKKQCFMNV